MEGLKSKPKKSHRTKFTVRNFLLLVFFVVQVFVQCYFWSDIHQPTSTTTTTTTTSVKEAYLNEFKKMNSNKRKQTKVLPDKEEEEKEEKEEESGGGGETSCVHTRAFQRNDDER